MELTDGFGFGSVIEASGSVRAVSPALDIVCKGGTVVYFSMYPNYYEMPVNLFKYLYYRGITLRGFLNSPFSFYRAVDLLPRLNLKALIHKVYPIEKAVQAFEAQATGKYAKILIHCNPDLT
ncbi:D-arabitol-phosphate dehydrogenase [bioreactor metagenome]|uniref:D-arabitol-phosphate dehydrogenase n=1 Tax=bioreactor metagenome TaxID=1076179 RepID=A0A645JMX8_9ZZZZ